MEKDEKNEKDKNDHDKPDRGKLELSVTTLSGTSTGHFRSSETLQEVIDWVIKKQHLVINSPMVLSYNNRELNPSLTIEAAGIPDHAKLTYLAVIGGGGR
jgi:hypothetical protein